jgi:predicted NBD/HSP70 family sugar kinase
MSFPSVSSNVRNLLDNEYLIESGEGNNSLGRKSTLLSFNATHGYVIGADIGRSQMRVMLADLQGGCIVSLKEDMSSISNSKDTAHKLCEVIQAAINEGNVQQSKIRCVSIGIPGVLDKKTGEVIIAPFFGSLKLSDIQSEIEKNFDVPIILENSVNNGAIGEKWQGVAKGYKDIAYIDYGVGIGSALIINGELFRGVNGASGEIGFMVLDRAGIRSEYNDQGVLENLISGNQINKSLLQSGLKTDLKSLMTSKGDDSEIYNRFISELIDYIGMALINITSVINPELIVLSGGMGILLGSEYQDRWKELLANHVPFPPKIVTSKLSNKANVLGAVAAALRLIVDDLDYKLP